MNLWDTFVEAVGKEFRFLEAHFGFVKKSISPPFVSYESDKLRVSIYYDAEGRHELDLQLRRLADDPQRVPSVGLTAMMLLVDRQAAGESRAPFPASEASVSVEVQRFAELLRKYGTPFLKADEQAFRRLEVLRREREQELGADSIP